MITHIIYHIPGRKVGCTKDVENRKWFYKYVDKVAVDLEILIELHDTTDKEAGDIEWQWADALGYKRGRHYVHMMKIRQSPRSFVVLSPEKRLENGRKGGKESARVMSHEKRVEIGRKGGTRGAELGVGGFRGMNKDKLVEISRKAGSKGGKIGGKKGGLKGGRKTMDLGKSTSQLKAVCPHCGLESTRLVLGRWHFDNCKQRAVEK